jgi:hypothetical protein
LNESYIQNGGAEFENSLLQLIEDVEAVAPELISLSGVTGVGLGFREENGEFFDELAVRSLVAYASDVPAGISEEIAGGSSLRR